MWPVTGLLGLRRATTTEYGLRIIAAVAQAASQVCLWCSAHDCSPSKNRPIVEKSRASRCHGHASASLIAGRIVFTVRSSTLVTVTYASQMLPRRTDKVPDHWGSKRPKQGRGLEKHVGTAGPWVLLQCENKLLSTVAIAATCRQEA
jgi:hypothetical protein